MIAGNSYIILILIPHLTAVHMATYCVYPVRASSVSNDLRYPENIHSLRVWYGNWDQSDTGRSKILRVVERSKNAGITM